jgi:hypothetical protein
VHDSLFVRRFERVRDLLRNRQCFADREARPLCTQPFDRLGQIFALDELHDERLNAVGVLESVDRGDVGMIERREDFRFTLKTRQPFNI